jgi:hypothetical protein
MLLNDDTYPRISAENALSKGMALFVLVYLDRALRYLLYKPQIHPAYLPYLLTSPTFAAPRPAFIPPPYPTKPFHVLPMRSRIRDPCRGHVGPRPVGSGMLPRR